MRRAAMLVIRLGIGGLFLMAGLSKLGDPLRLLASVYSYRIDMPDWVALAVAHGLPWAEILLGAGLLAGMWTRTMAILAGAVLGGFFLLTAQAWWRELPIDCGCIDLGAVHPALAVLGTPGGAALRNLVLLGLCGLLWKLSSRSERNPVEEGKARKTRKSAVD